MREITAEEVEKRLRAWADVTLLSLELERAALNKEVFRTGRPGDHDLDAGAACRLRRMRRKKWR